MNPEYLTYAPFAAIALLLCYNIYLHLRLKKLLHGNASSIEDGLNSLSEDLKNLHQFRKELEPYLTSVERRLKRSLQGMHTLRFDPFRGDGSGGKQSFASAFVNENGDGVVISTLHSRDRMNVYGKPVSGFSSSFDLTEEETKALLKAKESCTL